MNAIVEKPDAKLKTGVLDELKYEPAMNITDIGVLVKEGAVTLSGFSSSFGEKWDAVKGVTNLITIKSSLSAANAQASIEAAFKRSALLDAEKIHVETSGHNFTLRGKVRNHAEHDEAERVALAAPDVWPVNNEIDVKRSWGMEN
jgi:osmotically-inducible protein OsmY